MSRFVASYARIPTYSESAAWKEAFDQKVADYLGKHPELLTSPRASQFRFERRVFVGMSKEEILLLVDAPQATTGDEAVMRVAAKKFWPEIQQRAKEMWLYPSGWQFYFAGDRLVDLTVAGQPPLE